MIAIREGQAEPTVAFASVDEPRLFRNEYTLSIFSLLDMWKRECSKSDATVSRIGLHVGSRDSPDHFQCRFTHSRVCKRERERLAFITL